MTGSPRALVHPNRELLAQAVAARLLTRLVDVQAARGHAHLVLTGGGTGIAVLAAVAASGARDAVDWSAVELWWGDERFLPDGHPERNATQARHALLDHVGVDPALVHEMPAPRDPDDDPEDAARRYCAELAAAAPAGASVPVFDVLLLGVGPDGHVASLFPGRAEPQAPPATYVVRESPKPPPTRLTLARWAINRADQVWLVAAGPGKAAAIARAWRQDPGAGLLPADAAPLPAATVHGTGGTLWLLDRDVAAGLPPRERTGS